MSERMSDAELQVAIQAQEPWRQPASDQEPALAAIIDEALRARASEAALQAEREGQTGAPTESAWYWGEINDSGIRDVVYWGPFGWATRDKKPLPGGLTVTRYWRLPGETYTETPHDA